MGLLWRRLGGHSLAGGVDNGVVQAAEAAADIVALLATVVGVDDEGGRVCSVVARALDVAMERCRDMAQQGIDGDF